MRYTILSLILCGFLAGCMSAPAQYAGPTTPAGVGATVAQQSVMSSGLVSQGCKVQGGLSCGGKSLLAGAVEFDPAGIVEGVVGQASRAVAIPAPVAPVRSQAAPCGGHWITETRQVWVGD